MWEQDQVINWTLMTPRLLTFPLYSGHVADHMAKSSFQMPLILVLRQGAHLGEGLGPRGH